MNRVFSIFLILFQAIVQITEQQQLQVITRNVTVQYKADILLTCGEQNSTTANAQFYRKPLYNLNSTNQIQDVAKKFQLANNSLKIISPSN